VNYPRPLMDQYCQWSDEAGDPACSQTAVVVVGPQQLPVCLPHFEHYLADLARGIDRFLARRSETLEVE
jgi:hypothetical protein